MCVAALLQVTRDRTGLGSVLQGFHRLGQRIIQRAFAQAGHAHQVLALQQAHRRKQVFDVLIAHVGDQHHQRAAALTQ